MASNVTHDNEETNAAIYYPIAVEYFKYNIYWNGILLLSVIGIGITEGKRDATKWG